MNQFPKTIFFLLASLVLGACNSSDDESQAYESYEVTTVSEAPSWQVNWAGDEARPDWKEPSSGNYENWAVILVGIEDALKPFADDGDLMALFVGNELRGLAKPVVSYGEANPEDKGVFLLKVYANEPDQKQMTMTLRYYSCRLNQIFSLTTDVKFRVGAVLGIDEDFVPQFTLGSSKYPVVVSHPLSDLSTQIEGVLVPAMGDIVALFAGDECRGVYKLEGLLLGSKNALNIFARNSNETVTMKYYQRATNKVYTFKNPIKVK